MKRAVYKEGAETLSTKRFSQFLEQLGWVTSALEAKPNGVECVLIDRVFWIVGKAKKKGGTLVSRRKLVGEQCTYCRLKVTKKLMIY